MSTTCRSRAGFSGELSHRHDRRRSVTEQPGRNDVRGTRVVALHRQRAEFHRNEHGDARRVAAEEVVQSSDPRRAGQTTQAEQWNPLDVCAQPDPRGDARLQRGHQHTGDRGRHDQIHVGWLESGFG